MQQCFLTNAFYSKHEQYKNSTILSPNWKMQEAQNGISVLDVEVNSDLH
jgi:hypothetical protein